MSANDLTHHSEPPVAHPLAVELARFVAAATPPARVLVLGVGSGRNLPVLLASGARVEAIEDDVARLHAAAERFTSADVRAASYGGPYPFARGFAGALSTHALLHGRRPAVEAAIASVRDALLPDGRFFTTLGSMRDPRCGTDGTFIPTRGFEAGVPHIFFDEAAVRELFADFELQSLEEVGAADTAGRWAHSEADARTLVHWFVRARIAESVSDVRATGLPSQ